MIQSAFLLVVVVEALSRTHSETGRKEMTEARREIFVGIDFHKRRWLVTLSPHYSSVIGMIALF
jgi:hypothetical protein